MDLELETWIEEVMENQNYQNGLRDMLSVRAFLRKLVFGSA
ncbi:MAG: Uncharacterised protein [Methanobacteriota archaeon]|jgi:hypothetical protein|nr:MAG: Uncharacterised protein [Euryarchaeota archaeon]|tara:strand:- start:690 stop:812 length:123 start_codon:yes stop_codon:yes gene_type:complete